MKEMKWYNRIKIEGLEGVWDMKTITIGRQYGSGGRQVGALLAKSLNIPFYDGNLLLIAAEKDG